MRRSGQDCRGPHLRQGAVCGTQEAGGLIEVGVNPRLLAQQPGFLPFLGLPGRAVCV